MFFHLNRLLIPFNETTTQIPWHKVMWQGGLHIAHRSQSGFCKTPKLNYLHNPTQIRRIAGGVRIPFQELLQQQPNQIMQYPLYDRCKEAAGTIQVSKQLL